jgi:tellurite resistance protein TehA-like permease
VPSAPGAAGLRVGRLCYGNGGHEWIPILLALGAWRHLRERVPLTYEHGYWAIVFPLGMYTVCTQNLIRVFPLPLLEPIAAVFVWIALAAWGLTFAGLARYVLTQGARPSQRPVRA